MLCWILYCSDTGKNKQVEMCLEKYFYKKVDCIMRRKRSV